MKVRVVRSSYHLVPWGWPERAGGCVAFLLIVAANAAVIYGIVKLVRWAWNG